MTQQELPSRQKSQRLIDRMRHSQQQQHFQRYRSRAKNIANANELLPGLNDISDAFEALPLDLIKYFTLLKEIDAKCINTVPVINHQIESYIDKMHSGEEAFTDATKTARLTSIRNKVQDVIPCLEEKMHVTSVAADMMQKHLFRINNDYKLIIHNNEIPESIRIGPLNHPAMILDLASPLDHANPNKSAQSQRSESRREALAARKAHKDLPDDDDGVGSNGELKKRGRNKETTPFEPRAVSAFGNSKKRVRRDPEEISRPPTPNLASAGVEPSRKRATTKPKRDRDDYDLHKPPNGPQLAAGGYKGTLGPQPQLGANNTEPTYCYCNQVSFGEMVGCDGDDCKREWFHLPCIGFKNPPKGKWYCDDCLSKMKKLKKV